MTDKLTVSVLGTGIMGAAMARNLVRAGHSVRAWNRSRDKAEPLAADGAHVVDTPWRRSRAPMSSSPCCTTVPPHWR